MSTCIQEAGSGTVSRGGRAETYLDLIVIISPFALEPILDLPRVEAIIVYFLDSLPRHRGDTDMLLRQPTVGATGCTRAESETSRCCAILGGKADFVPTAQREALRAGYPAFSPCAAVGFQQCLSQAAGRRIGASPSRD